MFLKCPMFTESCYISVMSLFVHCKLFCCYVSVTSLFVHCKLFLHASCRSGQSVSAQLVVLMLAVGVDSQSVPSLLSQSRL